MKLGIYCRISKLKEGNDLSIDDQKQKGIAKAKELDLPYELYIDEGVSGAVESISERPQFERLIGDISTNVISHVFCYDQSRLERNPQMRFIINDLFRKNNIIFITQMGGIEDLNDPQQQFFGDLLSVINKFHVTTTKIKVKSALRLRVNEGKTRGVMPYGYTKDDNDMMIIDENEAIIVKRIFDLSLSGTGTRTIAEILNNENVPTRYNIISSGTISVRNKYTNVITTRKKKDVQWAPNTVMNILKNSIYKGERVYSGITTQVPAIFTHEYWNRVNFHLPENKNNSGKKVEYRYLLKGLLRCGVCGRNMYGHKRLNKHDNHYMCSSKRIRGENCGNRSINIDKIEYLIWHNLFIDNKLKERIIEEFKLDDFKIDRIKDNISGINKNLSSLNNERKRAIDLVIKGVISENDIADNLKEIDLKINEQKIILKENQQKMFALENSEKIISKYKNVFVEFTKVTTFEQKFKIVNDFISNIIVNYNIENKTYNIEVEFKVNMPKAYIGASFIKYDNWYFTDDVPRNNTSEGFKSIEYLPMYYDKELYDDGTNKFDESDLYDSSDDDSKDEDTPPFDLESFMRDKLDIPDEFIENFLSDKLDESDLYNSSDDDSNDESIPSFDLESFMRDKLDIPEEFIEKFNTDEFDESDLYNSSDDDSNDDDSNDEDIPPSDSESLMRDMLDIPDEFIEIDNSDESSNSSESDETSNKFLLPIIDKIKDFQENFINIQYPHIVDFIQRGPCRGRKLSTTR